MWRFLKTICEAAALSILIIWVPIAVIIACRYNRLLQEGDSIFSMGKDVTVAVFGDSHARHSFTDDPTYCIKKFTFSASPLNVSLMRLKELEHRGELRNVKVCVVNFCYTTFSEMSFETQIRAMWQFLPFSLKYVDSAPPVWGKYGLYARLLDFTLSNLDQCPPIADGNNDNVFNRTVQDTMTSLADRTSEWIEIALSGTFNMHFSYKENPSTMIPGMDEYLFKVIQGFKTVCERNDIKLIFVSTPLSDAYRVKIPTWAHEKMDAWVSILRGMGISYCNYMAWGEPKYFRDLDHLNRSGAEVFTKTFLSEALDNWTSNKSDVEVIEHRNERNWCEQ